MGPFSFATCNYLLSWELNEGHSSLSFTIGIAIHDLGILPNYTIILIHMFFYILLSCIKKLVVVNNVLFTPYISMKNGVD